VRALLATGCRILAAEGHESGLAGQFTARADADSWWTLPFGVGFDEARELLLQPAIVRATFAYWARRSSTMTVGSRAGSRRR